MICVLWHDDEFVCVCGDLSYSRRLFRICVSPTTLCDGWIIVAKIHNDLSTNYYDECNYANYYKGSVMPQLLQAGEEGTM